MCLSFYKYMLSLLTYWIIGLSRAHIFLYYIRLLFILYNYHNWLESFLWMFQCFFNLRDMCWCNLNLVLLCFTIHLESMSHPSPFTLDVVSHLKTLKLKHTMWYPQELLFSIISISAPGALTFDIPHHKYFNICKFVTSKAVVFNIK